MRPSCPLSLSLPPSWVHARCFDENLLDSFPEPADESNNAISAGVKKESAFRVEVFSLILLLWEILRVSYIGDSACSL